MKVSKIIIFLLIFFTLVWNFNYVDTKSNADVDFRGDLVLKKQALMDWAQSNMQTGDFLTTHYSHHVGMVVRMFYGTQFSHSAVVFRDPVTDQVFLMEVAHYFQSKEWRGVLLIPLETWLKFNKRALIGHCRLVVDPQLPFPGPTLKSNFDRLVPLIDLNCINLTWLRLLHRYRAYSPTPSFKYSSITCHEFANHLLQESGILRKEYSFSSFNASHYLNGSINAHLESGYKYEGVTLFK